MGCVGSHRGLQFHPPGSFEHMQQMASFTAARCPVLATGDEAGVLVLEGSGWIFNAAPPPLCVCVLPLPLGIPPTRYTEMVESLNNAHCRALVGESPTYGPEDIERRRAIGEKAVRARLGQLQEEIFEGMGCHTEIAVGGAKSETTQTGVTQNVQRSKQRVTHTTTHTLQTFIYFKPISALPPCYADATI